MRFKPTSADTLHSSDMVNRTNSYFDNIGNITGNFIGDRRHPKTQALAHEFGDLVCNRHLGMRDWICASLRIKSGSKIFWTADEAKRLFARNSYSGSMPEKWPVAETYDYLLTLDQVTDDMRSEMIRIKGIMKHMDKKHLEKRVLRSDMRPSWYHKQNPDLYERGGPDNKLLNEGQSLGDPGYYDKRTNTTRSKTQYENACDNALMLSYMHVNNVVALSQGLFKIFYSRSPILNLHANNLIEFGSGRNQIPAGSWVNANNDTFQRRGPTSKSLQRIFKVFPTPVDLNVLDPDEYQGGTKLIDAHRNATNDNPRLERAVAPLHLSNYPLIINPSRHLQLLAVLPQVTELGAYVKNRFTIEDNNGVPPEHENNGDLAKPARFNHHGGACASLLTLQQNESLDKMWPESAKDNTGYRRGYVPQTAHPIDPDKRAKAMKAIGTGHSIYFCPDFKDVADYLEIPQMLWSMHRAMSVVFERNITQGKSIADPTSIYSINSYGPCPAGSSRAFLNHNHESVPQFLNGKPNPAITSRGHCVSDYQRGGGMVPDGNDGYSEYFPGPSVMESREYPGNNGFHRGRRGTVGQMFGDFQAQMGTGVHSSGKKTKRKTRKR